MVVVVADLRFVGHAFVLAAGQPYGSLSDARAVDALQRHPNAGYQKVER